MLIRVTSESEFCHIYKIRKKNYWWLYYLERKIWIRYCSDASLNNAAQCKWDRANAWKNNKHFTIWYQYTEIGIQFTHEENDSRKTHYIFQGFNFLDESCIFFIISNTYSLFLIWWISSNFIKEIGFSNANIERSRLG